MGTVQNMYRRIFLAVKISIPRYVTSKKYVSEFLKKNETLTI